ncbi:MAG: H+/Na+-translocating ferredoxin:NAD+ oxidoreductase subunit [Pseudomonadota bacterium]|jgi:electron transport complex protein RnfB|nr:H+/Na+-translocating ferredoxin:NAD+ oxidoreductase subunit [Pseudomonadota bacterium]
MPLPSLADLIDAQLPQTQCTRCGQPDCRAYAEAVAAGAMDINRCPPGGHDGVVRLAALTGRPVRPLDADCGVEGPLTVAVIDEAWCIGCTLCIKACPVDCISGTNKHMHTVIEADCTGCELCLPACPVDCISLEVVTPDRSGWQAWTPAQAQAARQRYLDRNARRLRAQQQQAERLEDKARHKLEHLDTLTRDTQVPGELDRKRAIIEAALARARLQKPKNV